MMEVKIKKSLFGQCTFEFELNTTQGIVTIEYSVEGGIIKERLAKPYFKAGKPRRIAMLFPEMREALISTIIHEIAMYNEYAKITNEMIDDVTGWFNRPLSSLKEIDCELEVI